MTRNCTGWEKEIPHFVRNDRIKCKLKGEEMAVRGYESQTF